MAPHLVEPVLRIVSQINPLRVTPLRPRTYALVVLPVAYLQAISAMTHIHSSCHHSCYAPCLCHFPWCHHSDVTWQRLQVMKLVSHEPPRTLAAYTQPTLIESRGLQNLGK
jgi:hypothetical protein